MIRLQRRLRVDRRRSITLRLAGVVISLLVAGVVLQISGSPALMLGRRAVETMTTPYGMEQGLVLATPILLTALAVALGFRMRLWNIGVDGQLYIGALAATGIGLNVNGPTWLMLTLMMVAGAAGGAFWILGPALARAYGRVNEIITTLLMNFVALQVVNWLSLGPWRDSTIPDLSATRRIPYELPILPGTNTVPIGVIAPFLIAAVVFFIFRFTTWGYEVDISGGNARAAEYAGIDVRRRIVSVMCISGAIAGASGAILVAGTTHRLSSTISNQYGFSGFIVAALAAGAIVVLILVGLLVAGLLVAAITLQTLGLSVDAVLALYGLILIGNVVAEVAARYRVVRTTKPPPELQFAPAEALAGAGPQGLSALTAAGSPPESTD
ncbi:MAG: ABC transporter permease [Solirubrobacteraceae bacterium]|nr:ABC transporter permease [Solirubrobacteraceae bacterium]